MLAHKWMVQAVSQRVAQSHLDFAPDPSCPCIHGVIKDATRLGNPARDYEIYYFWRGDTEKGGWLLAQEPSSISAG